MQEIIDIESNFLIWIQENLRNDTLNSVLTFITSLNNAGAICIIFTIILLCFKKTRRLGIISAMALIGSLIVNNILLKNIVARTRPYEVIEGLKCLVGEQSDYSFPSGHTGSAFAVATVMLLETKKKYSIPILIFAIIIAFSRLYVGVHYPTDVLGGMITGIFVGVLASIIFRMLEKHKKLGKLEKLI